MFAPNLNFTPFVASASPAAASSSGSGGSGSQFTPGQGYNTPAPPAPTPAATRAFPDMGGPPGVALTPAEQQQADAFVQQGVDPQTAADWVVFGGTGPDYPGTANKAHGGPTHPLAHFMEARGGGARMVRGPSPGQADDVNAKLSDSEYVIDATTLADAGDGNPDAGARWFDQLREAIRHDKGRDKTPSPKIKSPLHYVHQLRRAA